VLIAHILGATASAAGSSPAPTRNRRAYSKLAGDPRWWGLGFPAPFDPLVVESTALAAARNYGLCQPSPASSMLAASGAGPISSGLPLHGPCRKLWPPRNQATGFSSSVASHAGKVFRAHSRPTRKPPDRAAIWAFRFHIDQTICNSGEGVSPVAFPLWRANHRIQLVSLPQ